MGVFVTAIIIGTLLGGGTLIRILLEKNQMYNAKKRYEKETTRYISKDSNTSKELGDIESKPINYEQKLDIEKLTSFFSWGKDDSLWNDIYIYKAFQTVETELIWRKIVSKEGIITNNNVNLLYFEAVMAGIVKYVYENQNKTFSYNSCPLWNRDIHYVYKNICEIAQASLKKMIVQVNLIIDIISVELKDYCLIILKPQDF